MTSGDNSRIYLGTNDTAYTGVDFDFTAMVKHRSSDADLVVLGLTEARLREKGTEILLRHPSLSDVLFVSAEEAIAIE